MSGRSVGGPAPFAGEQGPVQGRAAGVERREFLRLLGASLAAAGGACTRQPDEAIVPYGRAPEDVVPGVPLYFATAMPWASGALGLLVESHMGRPTKVEGNPEHPASLGATDPFAQAALLELYDPDRSQVVLRGGRIATFGEFLTALTPALEAQLAAGGAGLRVLTPTVTSPALAAGLAELEERFPRARVHHWEPLNRDRERAGALLAFGRDLAPRHHLERARVVLALDADFLAGPAGVLAMRQLAAARRARAGAGGELLRLYAAESSLSITGAKADHRLPLPPSRLVAFAGAVARALGVETRHADLPAEALSFAAAVAADLSAHRGAGLVIAGREQPAEVHALAHALNRALGNAGSTVTYGEPADERPTEQRASIEELAREMLAGAVELLVILGGNPVYDAPLDFAAALERVKLSVHLGLYEDETAELAHWHLAEAHFLESWGDARAADGTVSLVQPLIAPLYGGRTALELVALLLGRPAQKPYDALREHWRAKLGAEGFEARWRRALHDGWIAGTERPDVEVAAADAPADLTGLVPAALSPGVGAVELCFRADPAVHDGRFANNGWLQELPRPLTKLTWDNAALIGPATARALGLESGERLSFGAGAIEAPVWVAPDHAEGCLTLPLGYGRRRAGRLGSGVGFDAFAVARGGPQAPVKARGRHAFACTQGHDSLEGRDLVRVRRAGELEAGEHAEHGQASLYPGFAYDGRAWGMVIDLNACTGCSACVVACQAENNIPIVGKDQVARGRELHWIRVDRYFEEGPLGPTARFLPVPCMHCENAPCEVVCPVGATTHSPEGLNEMTYNRCIGTRYCANNCPYKVRRFNFYRYADWSTESLALARNPDVSVRSRGVMEKCSYCVQRINQARIAASKADRPIADGEVRTACQAVCPAQAIAFGDLNDPSSEVARLRREPHHYGLLTELNTRPRTTYLADVEVRNPALEHLAHPFPPGARAAPAPGGAAEVQGGPRHG